MLKRLPTGAFPDHSGGAYDALLDLLVEWGEDISPHSVDAFGVSFATHSAIRLLHLETHNSHLPVCPVTSSSVVPS